MSRTFLLVLLLSLLCLGCTKSEQASPDAATSGAANPSGVQPVKLTPGQELGALGTRKK